MRGYSHRLLSCWVFNPSGIVNQHTRTHRQHEDRSLSGMYWPCNGGVQTPRGYQAKNKIKLLNFRKANFQLFEELVKKKKKKKISLGNCPQGQGSPPEQSRQSRQSEVPGEQKKGNVIPIFKKGRNTSIRISSLVEYRS